MTTDQARWVQVTRRIDASPSRVHRAWSDPEELAGWFPRQVEGSLTVGTRSILTWHDRRVPIDVLASDPPHLFQFRWSWPPERQPPDGGHGQDGGAGLRHAVDPDAMVPST